MLATENGPASVASAQREPFCSLWKQQLLSLEATCKPFMIETRRVSLEAQW